MDHPPVTQTFRDELSNLFGDRASFSLVLREQHSHGEGYSFQGMPDAVVFAETADDVADLVKLCRRHGVPVVPFGAGSSLEGHVAAVRGGVSLNMMRMNRILDVSVEALDCRVEAGVTREQLNAHLRTQGLFFSVDPGADATIGGMAATRASGTNAVRYGTIRENVLGLTVVTPSGVIIRTGGRARKSSAGLDLTRLYVGSEGTLGVITEVQVRLQGLPEAVLVATCQFDTFENAVATVTTALQSGLRLARIELLDEVQMRGCIGYSKLEGFAAKPTLFMEFHGSPAGVREDGAAMQKLALEFNGRHFRHAERPEERTLLWKARHNCYHATKWLCPGKDNMGTDACVPLSEFAACITETKQDVRDSGLIAPLVGHVGDGNFHLGIMHDRNDPDETARAEALAVRVAERAIRYGGTCTGEHGIGLHKRRFMEAEHGAALDVMRAIKQALDPDNIMNPGKMLPDRID
ncbi:FAD-binding oxidoreductase [Chelatococcus asaccharovorans]|uniref:D-lactate dehydrogenase (cytochrome) n=1 Tax=Chelatococcus asaccharovorans TaxID=28210 RepID=A0A2V3TWR7_9HYPH|nr:FAD-linked oxidase C-terminal domain-containing protein [Chelatococcus asaccharovorans]PXW53617.1 D-lactate dehydrogenase (cytochrome) [Chelatococcus asaccharovorans]CAH1652669.1 D-lactate dehydrogenase (Cytochrome) [Chelatococcus asaccharovorans]CAH1686267.1 D-lactate dehydrogenase (Cytochrome) [Chelatococcus asaccharovorans]